MDARWLLLAALTWSADGFVPTPGHQEADSTRVLDQARAVQRDFEIRRRHLLPVTYASRGRCDETIGRFCYWYDTGDTTLPAEPVSVHEARARLLDTLRSLHEQLPGNEWLLGQRVRYLVEHGDTGRAAALTADCGEDRWWCHALNGFARHAAGRFAEADTAFDRALFTMPWELRCEWTDWSRLLDGSLYERARDTDCSLRDPLVDSLLWLADPLLMVPGNDLRTELLSRRVVDWMLRTSRSPQAMPWGRDVTELFTRYGWPVRWSVAESRYGSLEPGGVIGHDPSPAFSFFPTREDSGWRFELERDRPRSRYAPAYGRRFTSLNEYQVARFPRGDSMLVAGAVDLSGDTAFARGAGRVALVASVGPGTSPIVAEAELRGGPATFVIAVPLRDALVGIEGSAGEDGRIVRSRSILEPLADLDGAVLSDILLYRIGDRLPGSLEEAVSRALPATRWRRGEPVGVYWEMAGLPGDSTEVSVAVVPERRGLLGRIGQSLSLVARRPPLTVEWTLPERGGHLVGRAFELGLERLDAGSYMLVVTVATRDGAERSISRTIELTK